MTVVFDLDRRGGAPGDRPGGSGSRRRKPLSPRARRQMYGLGALALFAVVIAGVLGAYNEVFTPGVPATVVAPEAGLLMTNGADVTLNGVTVGRVTSITPTGNQARLGISLFPGEVTNIPSNIQAEISAPTVFGPKFLNLVAPAKPAAARVTAGQIIEPASSPTEIDTVFANLVSVLKSVHPAKLSATLGAISTALQGNGPQIASFVTQLNSYLKQFNPAMPALGNDLQLSPTVANAYDAAAPDLIKTLDNLRVTSGTLTTEQAQVDAFLVDLSGFAGNTQSFLSSNEKGLTGTLSTLLPTTGVLAQYSPEFQCLFASINQINKIDVTNNIVLNTALVPGSSEYKNPQNLPVVGANSGPSCYGGPLTKAEAANWGRVTFDDGTQDFFSNNPAVTLSNNPLAVQLFGPSAAGTATAAAESGKGK